MMIMTFERSGALWVGNGWIRLIISSYTTSSTTPDPRGISSILLLRFLLFFLSILFFCPCLLPSFFAFQLLLTF